MDVGAKNSFSGVCTGSCYPAGDVGLVPKTAGDGRSADCCLRSEKRLGWRMKNSRMAGLMLDKHEDRCGERKAYSPISHASIDPFPF